MKRLSNGRLVLIQIGNHDIATYDKKSRCFKEMNSSLLKEALSPLPNVIFLDEVNNLYLNDNQKIAQCGYEGLIHTNLNFVGFDLPWDYYFRNRENFFEFKKAYDDKIISNRPFIEKAVNILDIHTIVNFIKLGRTFPQYFDGVEVAVGGHTHWGLCSSAFGRFIPGNRGFLSPDKKILAELQRGIELFDKANSNSKLVCSIGNSVNVRVEMPFVNDLVIYGPSVRFINFIAKSDNIAKSGNKVKVRYTTFKFR